MFNDWPSLLLVFFVLTVSLSFHEAAHALIALRLGDDTAKRMGRLTLNPLVHLDPIGSLMILSSLPIGWAKPVPVNPANIRNPRTGMPLVAFAGPLSNLILAVIACIIHYFIGIHLMGSGWYTLLAAFIHVNFSLAIFNLLPVMPLDGSKIITTFMSDRVADRYEAIMEQAGVFPLIFIIAVGFITPGSGIIGLWFRFWRPLIYPILGIFDVPYGLYPG